MLRGAVLGVCNATLGAHRLDGKVERVIAIYDVDDEDCPVLIFMTFLNAGISYHTVMPARRASPQGIMQWQR